jgi:hypothetical protein
MVFVALSKFWRLWAFLQDAGSVNGNDPPHKRGWLSMYSQWASELLGLRQAIEMNMDVCWNKRQSSDASGRFGPRNAERDCIFTSWNLLLSVRRVL